MALRKFRLKPRKGDPETGPVVLNLSYWDTPTAPPPEWYTTYRGFVNGIGGFPTKQKLVVRNALPEPPYGSWPDTKPADAPDDGYTAPIVPKQVQFGGLSLPPSHFAAPDESDLEKAIQLTHTKVGGA